MKFTYAAGDRPVEGYTLQHGIGRGGFGEVYAGVSDGGKEVALKLVQRNLEVELRGVGQCLNLKHQNLVAVYDVKKAENGDCWVIMEYIAGQTLDKAIAQNPQGMPQEEFLVWLQGISEGVGYLHDEGIVHRDLKPGNLFLEKGIVKIGDYGLSKFISASRRSGQTASIGTVHYMAPEVVQGRYGKELDLYSIGVISYEMLTGRVPFDGDSPGEILMKHLTAWPDLNVLQPLYRPVIARLLDKDPQRRYPSMQAMLADLNASAGSPVIPIPRPAAPSSTRPSIQEPSYREPSVPVWSAANMASFAPGQVHPPHWRPRDRVSVFPLVALLIGAGVGLLIFSFHGSLNDNSEALAKGLGGALLVSGGVLLVLFLFQGIAGWFRAQSKSIVTSQGAGTSSGPPWGTLLAPLIVSVLFGVGTGTSVLAMNLISGSREIEAIFMGWGFGFLACALSASFFLLRQRSKKSGSELVDTPQAAKTVVPASQLQPTGPWHPPQQES